jgi:hypothetical protein
MVWLGVLLAIRALDRSRKQKTRYEIPSSHSITSCLRAGAGSKHDAIIPGAGRACETSQNEGAGRHRREVEVFACASHPAKEERQFACKGLDT